MSLSFAISGGDPAGIGSEILCKSWQMRHEFDLPSFFILDDPAVYKKFGLKNVARIEDPLEAASCFDRWLPVLKLSDCPNVRAGEPDIDGAHCALQALEMAVGLARSGIASGVVTAPVSKSWLQKAGFTHLGQTEFVAERCGVAKENTAMMLVGPDLRVVPITIHIPFSQILDQLTSELIVNRTRAVARGLKRNFAIKKPRIAMAGLNPHAGESGNMGDEETRIIMPAIAALREEGLDVSDPKSPDAMFHKAARDKYDVAICHYHDQALIPLKALYFDEGVNMTLGLPIIRTSPDHGTAYDIAGKNIASPKPMIAAIKLAQLAWQNRQNIDLEDDA